MNTTGPVTATSEVIRSNSGPARASTFGRRLRIGLAVVVMAAGIGATTAHSTFAAEVGYGFTDGHDQGVTCNFQTHLITVSPRADAFSTFPNGQWVASQIIRRDVTANGGWIYGGWQTTFVKSWTYRVNLGDTVWINVMQQLPGLQFSAYRNHQYSVYVEYQYANAANVWGWDDMHATSTYETVTSNGQHAATTVCQAGF